MVDLTGYSAIDIACRAHLLAHNVKWSCLWPFDVRDDIEWDAVRQHIREKRRASYPKSRPHRARVAIKQEFYSLIMPSLMMIAGPEVRVHDVPRTEAAKLILGFRAIIFHDRRQFLEDAQDAFAVIEARFRNFQIVLLQ